MRIGVGQALDEGGRHVVAGHGHGVAPPRIGVRHECETSPRASSSVAKERKAAVEHDRVVPPRRAAGRTLACGRGLVDGVGLVGIGGDDIVALAAERYGMRRPRAYQCVEQLAAVTVGQLIGDRRPGARLSETSVADTAPARTNFHPFVALGIEITGRGVPKSQPETSPANTATGRMRFFPEHTRHRPATLQRHRRDQMATSGMRPMPIAGVAELRRCSTRLGQTSPKTTGRTARRRPPAAPSTVQIAHYLWPLASPNLM